MSNSSYQTDTHSASVIAYASSDSVDISVQDTSSVVLNLNMTREEARQLARALNRAVCRVVGEENLAFESAYDRRSK